jgi:hypothetical protein
MGMAIDQLVGKPVYHFVNRKGVLLFRHLSIKQNLEHQVAEFTAQFIPIAIVNGFEDFISLFDRVGLDGVEGLFAVPWASARTPQAGHDRNRAFEAFSSSGHGRNHCK